MTPGLTHLNTPAGGIAFMLMGILAISVTGMLITPLSIPLLGDLPGPVVITGIALTLGAGLFVFLRKHHKRRSLVSGRRIHRRH